MNTNDMTYGGAANDFGSGGLKDVSFYCKLGEYFFDLDEARFTVETNIVSDPYPYRQSGYSTNVIFTVLMNGEEKYSYQQTDEQ